MNKKKMISILICVVAVVILVILLLFVRGCDNQQVATADEAVIETRIETVTEIATDQQGSTFIEEATKVVEVKATEKATKPTENETGDNNSSKTDTSSNKTSSSSVKSESSNKNTSSSNSSSSTTNKNNSSSTTNKNNSSSSGSSSSSTTSKPSSSGSSTSTKTWHEAEYEYINHPAVTEKVWVVDKKAYTYEEPVYEKQGRAICNDCGADITDDIYNHSKNHALNGGNGSYSVKKVEVQVGTKTVSVPEEGHWETRVVKDAWTEKKLVREAGYY